MRPPPDADSVVQGMHASLPQVVAALDGKLASSVESLIRLA